MGSGPSMNTPSWTGQTPTDQAPMQSSSPGINYSGSFGQPSNNFQGMGKSPQMGAPMGQAQPPASPMAPPMEQPQQQAGISPIQQLLQQRQTPMDYNGGFSPQDYNLRFHGE